MRKGTAVGAAALAICTSGGLLLAQQSASFALEGTTLNEAGRPENGTLAQSGSFQITLDAVGEALPAFDAVSASFNLSGGVVGAYAPSAEVQALGFVSAGGAAPALAWAPLPTAVRYDVYRGATGSLPGSFGACLASNLASTSYNDAAAPLPKTGFFYLVTGENRLGEEGTKGYQSNGAVRTAAPACP